MGNQNVRLVYGTWGDLPHLPFRVLVYMALLALDEASDKKPARRCWASREQLAVSVLPPPDSRREGDVETAKRSVKRAITKLVEVGALVRVQRGGYAGTAEFDLIFDRRQGAAERTPTHPATDASTASPRGPLNVPLQGAAEGTPQGATQCPDRGPLRVPPTTSTTTPLQARTTNQVASQGDQQTAREAIRDEELKAASTFLNTLEAGFAAAQMEQLAVSEPSLSTRELVVTLADRLRGRRPHERP
ncbi:hypothetical protein GCM10025864_24390 [Luteimicrobium album]|uniref:Helix-turn-helix domain-containing protein n=1 Tax=Luteimicrobium album TaxID=1054550 RepID=A0ABQ6I2E6_9MICO|nr:hypothetical protein [Luteimicrobium album]GMA24680.1 hypothetical protein GCM10025864_24390 [Luteimicrobium album]